MFISGISFTTKWLRPTLITFFQSKRWICRMLHSCVGECEWNEGYNNMYHWGTFPWQILSTFYYSHARLELLQADQVSVVVSLVMHTTSTQRVYSFCLLFQQTMSSNLVAVPSLSSVHRMTRTSKLPALRRSGLLSRWGAQICSSIVVVVIIIISIMIPTENWAL